MSGYLNRILESFLLSTGSLLLGLLGSLFLGFLLGVLILSRLLVAGLLGGQSSLSLLDFSDGFLSESLSVLRASSFEFSDVLEGDTFDSSLLSEDFLLLVLSLIGLL